MITVTRRIEFDAAHRVLGHEGKCRHLHGHRYACEITVQAPELDPLGRVVDFGVVKQLVGGWVDDQWDHGALLNERDPLVSFRATLGKVYLMKGNPTAENIAAELYLAAESLLPSYLRIVQVRVYETPSCWADFFPGTAFPETDNRGEG